MRRFMLYLKNDSYSPKDATELLHRARDLIERGEVVVRDARVSRNFIEYDISLPSKENDKEMFAKMSEISPISSAEEVVERHIPKDEAIKLAIKSFNDEKYWTAHELLEGVWKSAEGVERSILNGIILVAAAFVHDEKAETAICLSILRRALAKLENAQGKYSGIDIDRLAGRIVEIINSGRVVRFTI
jgi:hypothetical protein